MAFYWLPCIMLCHWRTKEDICKALHVHDNHSPQTWQLIDWISLGADSVKIDRLSFCFLFLTLCWLDLIKRETIRFVPASYCCSGKGASGTRKAIYSLQCTVYSVQFTAFIVHSTLCSVHYAKYTLPLTLYINKCTVKSIVFSTILK